MTERTTTLRKPRGDADASIPKPFPVTLKKGYVPVGADEKVPAGKTITLPLDEAKTLIGKGLAERADALPE